MYLIVSKTVVKGQKVVERDKVVGNGKESAVHGIGYGYGMLRLYGAFATEMQNQLLLVLGYLAQGEKFVEEFF